MNKLAYYILSAILLTLSFSSCSDDEKAAQAAATLTAVKATSHSLEFTITPQYAEKCAWVCYKKGETAPSAEDILSQGISASNSETTTQRAIGLEAETRYIIQAAAVSQGRYLLSEPLEMKTLYATEQDIPVIKLKLVPESTTYRTDNDPGNGNYVIRLASGETDKNALPANIGDYLVRLDLYHEADQDSWNATLPSGEYHAGTESAQVGCWDVETTNVFTRISSDPVNGVVYSFVTDGSIMVQRNGDTYTIDIDIVMEDGEPFRGHFKGDIIFKRYEPETPQGTYQPFTEDQHVEFTLAKGNYYGNWYYPHADDLNLQFFKGNFNAEDVFTNGYRLELTTYMHKLIDYNIAHPLLEAGTYTVLYFAGGGDENRNLQLPMTINKGVMTEFWGNYYPTGSYLEKLDSRTGKRYITFLESGTMTVTRTTDNQYQISCDFKTNDGLKVTCTFSGSLPIENKNNNDATKPAEPMSTLQSDIQVKLPDDITEITAYFYGEYLYPGLNSWYIPFFKEDVKGEYIQVEFFTDATAGMTLSAGTYTLEEKIEDRFRANHILPGYKMYNQTDLAYSWYGDKTHDDATGATDILAPIKAGQMTITREGDNYTFVFDFKDDANHKITGEWTGKVNIADYSE